MLNLFITVRFLDVIDILLVAFLLYQLYMLVRGTVAIRIFIGMFSIYMFWLLVKAMKMELLGSILGQVIGVGVIALIIVFQQEIRKFLLMLGNNYFNREKYRFLKILNVGASADSEFIKPLVEACFAMSEEKTGALIVLSRNADLRVFVKTGTIVNADISEQLIRGVFFKNSPLHDGAIIIYAERILAAGCVLPISDNPNLPSQYGLRHRAALGMTENTDTIVLVVSEENGNISFAKNSKIIPIDSRDQLFSFIKKYMN